MSTFNVFWYDAINDVNCNLRQQLLYRWRVMSSYVVNTEPASNSDFSNPIRKKVQSLVSQKLHTDQVFRKFSFLCIISQCNFSLSNYSNIIGSLSFILDVLFRKINANIFFVGNFSQILENWFCWNCERSREKLNMLPLSEEKISRLLLDLFKFNLMWYRVSCILKFSIYVFLQWCLFVSACDFFYFRIS